MSEQPRESDRPIEWTDGNFQAMLDAPPPNTDDALAGADTTTPEFPAVREQIALPPAQPAAEVDDATDADHEVPDDTDVLDELLSEQIEVNKLRGTIQRQLQESEPDAEQICSFAAELKAMTDKKDAAIAKEYGLTVYPNYDQELALLAGAGKEVIAKAYREAFPHNAALMNMLKDTLTDDPEPSGAAEFLATAYGLDDASQFRTKKGPHRHDENVRHIMELDSYTGIAIDSIEKNTPDDPAKRRDKLFEALHGFLGLSEDLSKEIEWATYSRINFGSDYLTAERSPGKRQRDLLMNTALLIAHFGKQNIELLHSEAGFANFDYYTAEQCQRMLQFIHKAPAMLEKLKAGDVTAVFASGKGDYNGASAFDNDKFEGPNKRSLYFEVHELTDLKRFGNTMLYRGIKPSTVVLSAHGGPGIMEFGDDGVGFSLTPQIDEDANDNHFVSTDTVMRYFADKYMQPSRGIDDDASAKGRMRVILKSCSADKPGESWPLSNAESMTYAMDNPNVDVYAADESIAIEKTARGIRMRTNFGNDTQPAQYLDANHLRLVRPDNRLVKTKVEEVKLWKDKVA